MRGGTRKFCAVRVASMRVTMETLPAPNVESRIVNDIFCARLLWLAKHLTKLALYYFWNQFLRWDSLSLMTSLHLNKSPITAVIHWERNRSNSTFLRRAKMCRANTTITTKHMSHFHSSRVNVATPRVSGERKLKITMLEVLIMLNININKTYILLLL